MRVIEVKTKKDIREFINFPLRLYKGNEYFVPLLYADEKKIFAKNNVYNEQCESVFYLAVKDGKTVGRIQGILQRVSNEKWNQKRVRFTRFDSIDDQDVANALFQAIENWAISKGMDEIVGPLGYSDLEREGLLIEGFEELSTYEEQYNYEYYARLIENYGFKKEIDWFEYKLFAPKVIDERLMTLSKRMMEKYELHLGFAKNRREFIKKWGNDFFEILDKTYVDIYQSVPFTDNMKKELINNFKLILNVNYATVILDKNNEIVGFALALPAIGKALQKSNGHLTPLAILRLLKVIRKPKVIDLALIGVIPEYRNKGIATYILAEMIKMLSDGSVLYAETNLNLETNTNIRNNWKAFDSVQHKKRRSFVKVIKK